MASENVESLFEITALCDFFLREDTFVDPHPTLKDVFLQLAEARRVLSLRSRRRVPITRVREHSGDAVTHAGANRV